MIRQEDQDPCCFEATALRRADELAGSLGSAWHARQRWVLGEEQGLGLGGAVGVWFVWWWLNGFLVQQIVFWKDAKVSSIRTRCLNLDDFRQSNCDVPVWRLPNFTLPAAGLATSGPFFLRFEGSQVDYWQFRDVKRQIGLTIWQSGGSNTHLAKAQPFGKEHTERSGLAEDMSLPRSVRRNWFKRLETMAYLA